MHAPPTHKVVDRLAYNWFIILRDLAAMMRGKSCGLCLWLFDETVRNKTLITCPVGIFDFR